MEARTQIGHLPVSTHPANHSGPILVDDPDRQTLVTLAHTSPITLLFGQIDTAKEWIRGVDQLAVSA
jgi:hypothetical protein